VRPEPRCSDPCPADPGHPAVGRIAGAAVTRSILASTSTLVIRPINSLASAGPIITPKAATEQVRLIRNFRRLFIVCRLRSVTGTSGDPHHSGSCAGVRPPDARIVAANDPKCPAKGGKFRDSSSISTALCRIIRPCHPFPSFPRSAWECRPGRSASPAGGPSGPDDAERRRRRSHAERGNEENPPQYEVRSRRPFLFAQIGQHALAVIQ